MEKTLLNSNYKKCYIIAVDLYLLRYKIKNKWYEIHDIIRDYLILNGHDIKYKKDDLIYDNNSIKKIIDGIEKNDN